MSELLFGIGLLLCGQENQGAWQALASEFGFYHVDRQDAEAAAELRLCLRQVGRQLALGDALVAVVALRYDLTLLTADGDFDAVPGVEHENWR